ncbi:Transcriptional regulator TrmB, partial [mine drainage metagenome]
MGTIEEAAVELGSPASEEFRRAVETLERVGLTRYEAQAYIALVARGVGDATAIAQAATIPRTSAYKVLDSLAAKGYAQPTGGKPI